MSEEHHASIVRELAKGGGTLIAAVAAGLFCARFLNELVPDALGIGFSMFAAGYLAGRVRGKAP